MAVTNLNPGVGPANSDIAATIATTPAVSAQISANVPSASAIASAVAAPSLAQITSAITTNAASAGVTIAAITSAGNSAGWGATGGDTNWVAVSSGTITNSTLNITGLSGYKLFRLIFSGTLNSDSNPRIRLNGLTSGYFSLGHYGGNSSMYGFTQMGQDAISMGTNIQFVNADVIIGQANLTGYKTISGFFGGMASQGFSNVININGMNRNMTTLSSISIDSSGQVFSSGVFTLYGGN